MVQQVLNASTAISAFLTGSLSPTTPIIISDTPANIQLNLDWLQPLSAAGDVSSVVLTPGSALPTLTISPAQAVTDAGILTNIAGYFALFENAVAVGNHNITGLLNALGNTVIYSGPATLYTIAGVGDGINFTVSGLGGVDHLHNVEALQFSISTEIVAATPGSGAVVTNGNIAEVFAAVLGRAPDANGMGYYSAILTASPNIPLTTFAQWFLNSPEYTATHNYASTTAGDAQFLTDSYNTLLGRAPSASELAWYQTNVISPFLAGLTPGSAAYIAADRLAHAYAVTDFGQSPEFLADIQVTATHPGSTQHWLVLI
jgi:hypothetical protein